MAIIKFINNQVYNKNMNTSKFIGRTTELEILKSKYSSDNSEFIVVYGRRRIGKTTLIKNSLDVSNSFYFMASRGVYDYELAIFINELSDKTGVYFGEIKTFTDLFKKIVEKMPNNFTIVIDEFPYLIEKDKGITAEFQKIWDTILLDANINLILSGSAISIMEQDVLGYKSPLYGRRTAQIHLKEFRFSQIGDFFPKLKTEERIKIYSALGGVPLYLQLYDTNVSFNENIINLFCRKGSLLYEEAEFLLQEELRETNTYFKILEEINKGAVKMNEIAQKSYILPNNLNKYLDKLELLQIIEKKYPLTIENKKQGIYIIKDKYFRFWLSFIYPNIKNIELEEFSFLKEEIKKISFPFSKTFEEICQEYLFTIKDLKIDKVGSWWYGENEIDIIAISQEEKSMIIGECKFENEAMNIKVLKKLEEKVKLVKYTEKINKIKYFLFSKSGFKDNLKEECKKRDNINLISIDDF